MSGADVRDERLGEALDHAVRGVEPAIRPERAIRKGNLRRAGRVTASLATVAVSVAGAIWGAAIVGSDGTTPATPSELATFSSPEAPWTFEYPSGWEIRTARNEEPELRANMLRTAIANGELADGQEYGPNSSPNATSLFGESGVVVLVQRFWAHAAPLGGESRGPGSFTDDAQNPGWTFRERAQCEGTLCFGVIEWLGPGASDEDRAAAAAIADSVRLADVERWTDTDGELTTLHDEIDRFTVTYPSTWVSSDVPINEQVCSPFEILALATYPLRPGGDPAADFQLPSNAVEDLGPNDFLIWASENGTACGDLREGGGGEGFPQRPERFEPSGVCGDFDQLCPDPEGLGTGISGIRGWWVAFEDEDRAFYVFVGMGEQAFADPARAQLVWDVLDSLRFLPR